MACRFRHGGEFLDAVTREKRDAGSGTSHCEATSELAPVAKIIGGENVGRSRDRLDKLTTHPQGDSRKRGAHLECDATLVGRQPPQARGETGQCLLLVVDRFSHTSSLGVVSM